MTVNYSFITINLLNIDRVIFYYYYYSYLITVTK